MPGAAAPSPLTSSVGVGAGVGWGQTTEKVSSFCWKGWALQWGVEGKEENGSLPDQESHLRGLPPNALSCLWWARDPSTGTYHTLRRTGGNSLMLKTDHLAIDSQHKARMLRHRAEEWAPKSSSEGPFSPVCSIQGSGGGGGCHWAVVSRGVSFLY